MSTHGRDQEPADRDGFQHLENVVGDVVAELEALRERARRAERRAKDLLALLGRFQSGEETPEELGRRLAALEAENGDLKERFARGRGTVERLLARIRFLEQQP